MCFGGGGKAPTPVAPPPPAPVPTETQAAVVKSKDQLERLRYGLASTIKTGPSGLTGTGPNLVGQQVTGKKTLGA